MPRHVDQPLERLVAVGRDQAVQGGLDFSRGSGDRPARVGDHDLLPDRVKRPQSPSGACRSGRGAKGDVAAAIGPGSGRQEHVTDGGGPLAVVAQPLPRVVIFSGHVSTKDPATGQPRYPCIVSVAATREEFSGLVLTDVTPRETLRHLNALVSPHPFDLETVRPVLEFDLTKYKFIDLTNSMEPRGSTGDPILTMNLAVTAVLTSVSAGRWRP